MCYVPSCLWAFELWHMLFLCLIIAPLPSLVIFSFLREACFDINIPTHHIDCPTICFYNTLYFSSVAFLRPVFIFTCVLFGISSTRWEASWRQECVYSVNLQCLSKTDMLFPESSLYVYCLEALCHFSLSLLVWWTTFCPILTTNMVSLCSWQASFGLAPLKIGWSRKSIDCFSV